MRKSRAADSWKAKVEVIRAEAVVEEGVGGGSCRWQRYQVGLPTT